MNDEIYEKLRKKIEEDWGEEQPIETMTFTFNEMLNYIRFCEDEIKDALIKSFDK